VFTALALVGLIVIGTYSYWVRTAGFRGVSPVMAENWTPAPWICWLSAAVLVLLFAASAAYRLHYRTPDETRQPIIVWHRGRRAYLNESRILMIAISATLLIVFVIAPLISGLLDSSNWQIALSALQMPQLTYLLLAILWLSLHGALARRNIPDLDRRMTPVPLVPVDFVITTILVAAITVGLVEAVTWSSFTLWLI
jgi:hypothetical protein